MKVFHERFSEWLSNQIALQDRMVEESYIKGFEVDVIMYGHGAHVLRNARDELKKIMKEEFSKMKEAKE